MAFLNPFLLFGIGAVSIPIIIHLLNRRKFERVVWAAMKFLRLSVEQNQRRIQIEDILLLLLRCLLIALIALCLARPAIRAASAAGVFGRARVTGVILLDNSYSMSASDGVQPRFEQAKKAAESILDTLPSGSSVALILASDVANRVIPEPTYDLNLVRKTIRDARLSDRTTDVEPSIRASLGILKGRPGLRKELYLITDGQANGWEKMDDIHNQLEQAKQEVQAQVVLIGSPLDANVGVSDLKMVQTDFPIVDQPLTFAATVKNYGTDANAEARNVRVMLKLDDDPSVITETVIESLKAGESKTVTLGAQLQSVGTHTVTVGIPIETDHLPADDSRTIAVGAVKDVRVLMVDGDPGAGGREASTAKIRGFLLLGLPPTLEDQYFIKVNTVSPADLEATRLDEYSVIVLSNVTDLSPGTLENFASYLRRGLGGLIVFPGSFTSPTFYNEQLVRKYHFLPASLGPTRGRDELENDSIYFQLQGSNFTSEVARMWSSGSGSPTSVKFWKAYELNPDATPRPRPGDKAALARDPYAAEAGAPQVVLSFGKGIGDDALDGKPAIMERQWGMGRVFEFCSTADNKWNTGAEDAPVMIPLLRKIVGVIVRRQDDALNVKVGDSFVFHPVDDLLGKDVLIGRLGQKDRPAESQRVEMVNRLPQVTFDGVDNSGAYQMAFPGDTPPIKFAAYADERESELPELLQAQRDRIAEVATVTKWAPGESLGAKIEKDRVGTELWTALAAIALVLATAETFLAHWFSRTK